MGSTSLWGQYIRKKKLKKKNTLKERIEVLQQSIERRFHTMPTKEQQKERISFPDLEDFDSDITLTSETKAKT